MLLSEMDPQQKNRFLDEIHKNVSVENHLNIQFGNSTVGGRSFLGLFLLCMERSNTRVNHWKLFRRALRAFHLARYFESTIDLKGYRIECGVMRGFSALFLSEITKSYEPSHAGDGLHLVDSFAGLSSPTPNDAIGASQLANGRQEFRYPHKQGDFASKLDDVQAVLREFPGITYHPGWIPNVLETIPENRWAFVHIDVDLYDPTLSCLEYFVPRLEAGGVIVNDDFSSPLFPGGGEAWRAYFERSKSPYVVLDSGQAVYVKLL